jgi:hypothetical protein
MSGGELPSPLASTPQLPLAPFVLIEETAADVEIFVIAGWQAGPFVLGKPLRRGRRPLLQEEEIRNAARSGMRSWSVFDPTADLGGARALRRSNR